MSDFKRAYKILKGYVQREFDRIQGLEEEAAIAELEEPSGTRRTNDAIETASHRKVVFDAVIARRYLGVAETATYEEVKARYDELVKRSDPSRCVDGSPEQRMATEIQRRLHQAFSLLTQEFSTTQKRFASLEVEVMPSISEEPGPRKPDRFASLEVPPEPEAEE